MRECASTKRNDCCAQSICRSPRSARRSATTTSRPSSACSRGSRGLALASIDDEFLDTLHCKHRTPKREHRTPRRCARRANNVSLPVCFFRTRSVQMKHRSSILRFVLAALAAMFALGGTVGAGVCRPNHRDAQVRDLCVRQRDFAEERSSRGIRISALRFDRVCFERAISFVGVRPHLPRSARRARRMLDYVRRSRCCRARQ